MQVTARVNAFLPQVVLLATAAAGGFALSVLHVPAGWMSGGMIAVAALAATGRAQPLNTQLRQIALASAGLVIGSGVTPDMLQSLSHYPASLSMMLASIAAVTFVSTSLLNRSPGWGRTTAFFASVPGALSYVFALAATTDASIPRIAVAQLVRVFTLMALVPLLVGSSVTMQASAAGQVDGPLVLAVSLIFGWAAGWMFEKVGVAGGMLFGPMLLSAILHGSGVAPGHLPDWVQIAGQILIGAWTGARFVGFDWRLLGGALKPTLVSLTASLGVSSVFAGLTSALLGISFAETLVAFAPGGLEAMTVLAFALGLDPLYVGAHHLVRFIAISICLPFVLRGMSARET